MAKRVITFGEIMMRLNPIGYLRLVQSDRFEATYAGGEANVAVSLAFLTFSNSSRTGLISFSFNTSAYIAA